ncbi:MAG: pyridoxamine 5'-phosphate oxidase family protein [Bifidobacteriaceae bacterium]|jgi:nitroimidazol reductase NimA-like FMN-containing flavoprotein (pyridoxamine 5'-phosphate oxidase superfamily)|nr:pyridoxamine 5'-phosphate oxidase family protein [Bifidobacteriaceae bacterium]
MRRADREVTALPDLEDIVRSCNIVHVAFQDTEGLAVYPLNFGYEMDSASGHLTLFLHSALEGRKTDALREATADPESSGLPVAFEMSTDHVLISGKTPSAWADDFRSVMGTGLASVLDDIDEARAALAGLMKQQAGMPHIEITDAQIRTATVWKIEVDYMTGKIHKSPKAAQRARTWVPPQSHQ